jgi:1-acyl-sn-glycerol-3-phosphate acyltransferase
MPRPLRILLTGLAFLVFNVGSAWISWVMIPLQRRKLRGLPPEEARPQWDTFYLGVYRFIVNYMRWSRLFYYDPPALPDDFPRDRPYVLIANHPTLIDILIIKATIPGATCLVKASLFRKPHLKNLLTYGNDFPGPERGDGRELGATGVLDTFVQRLEAGYPVVVFPEGTRSPRYQLRRFRRGAMEAAIRAGVPIVPIYIGCHPPTLLKGEKWHEVPTTREIRFHVDFMPIVETEGADAQQLTRELKAAYEERLRRDILEHAEPEARAMLGENTGAASHPG